MSEPTAETPIEAPEVGAAELATAQNYAPETTTDDQPNPNAEAAKYRVRAREAETALAEAQARLAVLQRAEIERLASAGLSHPSDIWTLSGNSVSDYITDAGTVDADKVSSDLAAILQERPGLRPRQRAIDPSQGSGNVTPGRRAPSWEALLK
jgi:hypothetical protein